MPVNKRIEREKLRSIVGDAIKFTGMLQATMGLEGQGVDKASLRRSKRQMMMQMIDRIQ